jgi:competence protein ComEC
MSATPSGVLRLRVLDVGEGDAILLILPGGKRAIVVDAFSGERVVEALEEEGVDEAILFLSHSDNDHILGVPYLLDNFNGDFIAFFYNRDRISAGLRSRYRTTLLALSQATQDMATRAATPPLSGEFNTNLNDMGRFRALVSPPVTLEVLHPAHHEQSSFIGTTTNDAAGVLRVTAIGAGGEEWHVLLAADVQLMGLSCLMHRFRSDLTKLQANILKFPHHGAWPSDYEAVSRFDGVDKRTMEEFLDAVNPQYVALSVGYGNSHGHVKADVFTALRNLSAKDKRLLRIVCTEFTDTCLITKGSCSTSGCAGDVEIRIGGGAHGGIDILPRGTAHARTILSVTDKAHAGCGHLL